MKKPWIAAIGMVALLSAPAFGQDDEVDRECAAQCRDTHQDCKFDAREAGATCLEDAGCDILRDDYREACIAGDRDDEVCGEARTAFRECVEPCRDARRDAVDACRDETVACLEDDCDIEEPIRRRPGRRGRRGRR